MIPKEKAKELVEMFVQYQELYATAYANAKQCALIAVNEMIIQNGEYWLLKKIDTDFYQKQNGYLFQVKEEINILC